MQRSTFHLSRGFQAAVYVSFGMLLLTGAGWMLAQQRLEDPAWERVPGLLLKIHGGAAMAALLVLGALVNHIRRGWNANKNRLSGALLIALNTFLIVTGYGLYYAGDEATREWLSRWHAWIGLVVFVLLPAHVIAGRLIIRRLHRQKYSPTDPSTSNAQQHHLP
jgi:hypothetical protein